MKAQFIKAPKFGRSQQEMQDCMQANPPFLFSIGIQEDLTSTNSSSTGNPPFRPKAYKNKKRQRKSAFNKILAEIGVSEKAILKKNPIKNADARSRSPNTSIMDDGKGLPF